MNTTTNVWDELNKIENIATRHKRASNLKNYLLVDLEMIVARIKKFRKQFFKEENQEGDEFYFADGYGKRITRVFKGKKNANCNIQFSRRKTNANCNIRR